MNERERYRRGLAVRREVLGDEHVDRALGARGKLDADFQDLLTRYAWGEVWARPGLPRRTRSLLTLALLVSLGRTDELRLHLRAARRLGVTRDEVAEVLLQTAIYCGLPAANAAFHLAAEVLGEESRRRPKPVAKRRVGARRARR